MIEIPVKEMTSLQGWNGLLFMNFKIVNAKNLKMQLKKTTKIRYIY